MNILVALVVGVVVGYVASVRMGSSQEGLIRNIIVGMAGAYVGGWLLRTMVESANPGGFGFGALVASSVGATALLLLARRFGHN